MKVGESHALLSVKTQSSNTNRSFSWEDEAPEEPRPRRQQQGVPPLGRALPSITLESEDPDELPLKGKSRFGGQIKPRWRKVRAAGRVLLTLIVLGGLAACAFLLYTFLSRDARFRIAGADNIEATGLTEVNRAEMLAVFGEDIGRNIFFVPLAERRQQLEEIPWVEKATVMRLLPDQIRVSIVERQPVAFVLQPDGRTGLVDANGVLLTMPAALMAQRHYSFPVVTGINANDPLATRKARMAVYQRLLAELDANSQHFSEQISEIDLTDPTDVRVLMPEQGGDILTHFGQDHFLERYQRYKAGINDWRQQHPDLVSVDLRYEQIAAVLSMPVGTNATQGAGNEQVAKKGQDAVEKPEKHASGTKTPRAKAKPAGKSTVKVKAASARNTSGQARPVKINAKEKRRAEARRVALKINQQKSASTTRAASSAELGQ
jgi:cell division protein FtsQ